MISDYCKDRRWYRPCVMQHAGMTGLLTQQDGQLHLHGVEELQLCSGAVPGWVYPKGVGLRGCHRQAVRERLGAEVWLEVHLRPVVDLNKQRDV